MDIINQLHSTCYVVSKCGVIVECNFGPKLGGGGSEIVKQMGKREKRKRNIQNKMEICKK